LTPPSSSLSDSEDEDEDDGDEEEGEEETAPDLKDGKLNPVDNCVAVNFRVISHMTEACRI